MHFVSIFFLKLVLQFLFQFVCDPFLLLIFLLLGALKMLLYSHSDLFIFADWEIMHSVSLPVIITIEVHHAHLTA